MIWFEINEHYNTFFPLTSRAAHLSRAYSSRKVVVTYIYKEGFVTKRGNRAYKLGNFGLIHNRRSECPFSWSWNYQDRIYSTGKQAIILIFTTNSNRRKRSGARYEVIPPKNHNPTEEISLKWPSRKPYGKGSHPNQIHHTWTST